MMKTQLSWLSASLFLSGAVCAQQLNSLVTAQEYADRGLRYADEFPGLANMCDITKPFKIAGQRHKESKSKTADVSTKKVAKKKRLKTVLAPTQVFDNLYYVGTGRVASWVIRTSEGLVVIDALNNNAQAAKYIDKGLLELGLNPEDIKYLIITHGHGDHYGGQEYLVNKYQPKVVMSDVEWRILEKPKLEINNPRWGVRPVRDVSVVGSESIVVGDTRLELQVTPGHTPGTLSVIFPVYDNGQKHMVALWGGTGLNYGPIKSRILAYSESAERFRLSAKVLGVDVFMSNHPGRDGSAQKMKELPTRMAGSSHSFVVGQEVALHAFDLLRDCTYAQALRIEE